MKILGEYVKKRRQELQSKHTGYSIRSMAKRVGLHHSYLSKLERGEHTPLSESRILALARQLDENSDVLLALSGKLPDRIVRMIKDNPNQFINYLYYLENQKSNGDEEMDSLTKKMIHRSKELEELTRRLRDEIQRRKQLQQKLQKIESEQRTILNNLYETIVISLDSQMNILWMNHRLAKEFKTEFDNIVNKKCYQALLGAKKPCQRCTVKQAMLSKEVQEEHYFESSDGQKWLMRSVPILDTHQKVFRIIRFGFNVTRLENTRQVLAESELRWKFALKVSQEGVWDWNILTGQVFFSRHWKEMIGYTEQELDDHISEWKSRIHPNDYRQTLEKLQSHLQGETDFCDCEHRILCRDRSYKWIRDRVMVFERDISQQPIRAIGTSSDVTKQRMIKRVLKESEEKHRILYNKTPAMLQSVDSHGRMITVSDCWLEKLDYNRGEVIGKPFLDFLSPDSRENMIEEILPAFYEQGWIKKIGIQMLTRSGQVLDVNLSATTEYNEHGHIKQVFCFISDEIGNNQTAIK
ncbi:MAG TPA: PAS domain-containing protein [Desulfohalobiaceae bacterium]|nr:PAS domain-containing protein [Desulfohalobiaceae bacterium]